MDTSYNNEVRSAALEGWTRAAPHDAALKRVLRELANDPDDGIRRIAVEKMGEPHHADDLDSLREYAATTVDPYLRNTARVAAETIAALVGGD